MATTKTVSVLGPWEVIRMSGRRARRQPSSVLDDMYAAAQRTPRLAEFLDREIEACNKVVRTVGELGKELAVRLRLFKSGSLSAAEFEAFLVERQVTGADAAYALAIFRLDIAGSENLANLVKGGR